jgi:hypothetical protein
MGLRSFFTKFGSLSFEPNSASAHALIAAFSALNSGVACASVFKISVPEKRGSAPGTAAFATNRFGNDSTPSER